MIPDHENYEQQHLLDQIQISSNFGYGVVLISFLSIQGLRVFVKRYATPTSVGEKNIWKWQNIQLSWCHSTITGLGSLYCFYKYPELSQDMVVFINIPTYALAAFSTGYFFSDFVDVIINSQRTAMWEILLHHIAGLSLLVYNVVSCRYIGYTNAALLAEVHSISLHMRKLMQIAGVSLQNPFYKVNSIFNFAFFFIFRIFAIAWITFGMFWDRDRVSAVYFYLLGVTLSVIWVINVVLLWRLVKNDIFRSLNTTEPTSNGKDAPTFNAYSNAENNNRGKHKAA